MNREREARGSQSHTLVRILLAREGIRLDEVSVLQVVGNPQAVAATVTSNLDAAVSSGIPIAERCKEWRAADTAHRRAGGRHGAPV